jgi:hypothetical protein
LVLAGISIDAPVRDRIPSRISESEEFSASIVRLFPSHEMTGATLHRRKHHRCGWKRWGWCGLGGRRIGSGWGGFLGLRRLRRLPNYSDTLDDQARPEHEDKRGRLGPENPSTASKPFREPGTKNFGHPFDPSHGSERATAAGKTLSYSRMTGELV